MNPRKQTTFPQWWHDADISPRVREKLTTLFTIHRDGYVRWYRSQPRFVCGKRTDPEHVEQQWAAKRDEIDKALANELPPGVHTYRTALSEFLETLKARIGAPKKPMAERTYHNYVITLNEFGAFKVVGVKIADMNIRDIGPVQFSAYAVKFRKWKPSGFDSVVCLIAAFFRWCVQMEYIDRYRPGPEFIRPSRQELRDARIGLSKSFAPREVATLYVDANHTVKCWIALGVCAAFINSDIANVTRAVMGAAEGVIDYRRRKRGKIRRVIPLPKDVQKLLKGYIRPEPTDQRWADLFFITEDGNPYAVTMNKAGASKPSNTVSRLFDRLCRDAGIKTMGRNFTGLRTTFFNLAPRGEWDLERKIIMGRAQGTIDLESYLEDVGLDRLRHVVNHVWSLITAEIKTLNTERQGAKASPPLS